MKLVKKIFISLVAIAFISTATISCKSSDKNSSTSDQTQEFANPPEEILQRVHRLIKTSRAEYHQKNQMEHLREAALADPAADSAEASAAVVLEVMLVQISTILVP